MNKNDVLKIIEFIAKDPYFKEFTIRKRDNSLNCKTSYGLKGIAFRYYNSYDLARDGLALEIQPAYVIRFNVLHKWFEKYCKRTLADQRESVSVGIDGKMLGKTDEFYFLENRNEYDRDLYNMYEEVLENAKHVFSRFTSLEDYYNYYVDDVINGRRNFPTLGFEWVIKVLTATKIVAPNNYAIVKERVLQSVEDMVRRDEPNTMMYYNDLPTIFEDLENTDFLSGKWG